MEEIKRETKPEIKIEKAALTDKVKATLLELSKRWESEDSCYGYHANSESDIEGREVYIATVCGETAGYLFGRYDMAKAGSQAIPAGTCIFEIEEIYVRPEYRRLGIGGSLFEACEADIRDAEYITLSTGTKGHRSIMHFYIDMMDMTFRSARLFKKIT